MSARDQFRIIQSALGVSPTGIPNDDTKNAFTASWDAALAEYRGGESPSIPSVPPAPPVPTGSFTIGPDHWLVGAIREEIPGGAPLTPICVVEHFTSGASARSSIEFWRTPDAKGACAHVVIDRDGKVFQCRPFNRTCGHAGVSRWVDPKTGQRHEGMNAYSVGIEIANAGDDTKLAKRMGGTTMAAKHRNGGPMEEWEVYPAPQLAAVIGLTKALVDHYGLHDVTGHECVSRERKNDPGPAFPMQQVREACGFSGLPVVFNP